MEKEWVDEFPGSVTVTDENLVITYMNDRAAATFAAQGGRKRVGERLEGCHKDRSKDIIKRIFGTGKPNAYTIEKKGVRKFIYQAPWLRDGRVAGLVEISVEIPADLPHYVRN